MNLQTAMAGVLTRCVLIALGLMRGLFQGLTDGIRNFRDALSSQVPLSPPRHTEYDILQRPLWLAGLGVGLIVLSVLA